MDLAAQSYRSTALAEGSTLTPGTECICGRLEAESTLLGR